MPGPTSRQPIRGSLTSARVDLDDRRRQPVDRPRGADPDIARAGPAPPPSPPARSRPASCPPAHGPARGIFVAAGIERRKRRRRDLVPCRSASMPMSASTTPPAFVHRRMKPVRGLQRAERHGQVEGVQRAQLGAAIAVDAARQVAGNAHDRASCSQLGKQQADRIVQPALQAGPEQASISSGAACVSCDSVSTSPFHCAARPFGGVALGLGQRRDPNLDPALRQMPRRDIAVTAIVARPAQDQRRHRSGKAINRFGQRRARPAPSAARRLSRRRSRPLRRRASLGGEDRAGIAPRLSAGSSPDATIRAERSVGRGVARFLAVEQAQSRSRRSPTCATKLAPGRVPSHASTRLDLRHQRDRRRPRGRCGPRANRRAGRDRRRPSQRTRRAVDSGTRGLTSSTGAPPIPAGRPASARSPAPSPRAVMLSRHAGTSLPSSGATASACSGSMPHNDVSSRSAAAASADPPPIPDATGKLLVERDRRALVDPRRFGAARRAARIARLSSSPPGRAANGP